MKKEHLEKLKETLQEEENLFRLLKDEANILRFLTSEEDNQNKLSSYNKEIKRYKSTIAEFEERCDRQNTLLYKIIERDKLKKNFTLIK